MTRPNSVSHIRRAILCAAALLVGAAAPASASDWPKRPVTLLVSFPPGGTVDAAARIIAPRLSEQLGQSVVVENKGGAGGMIGAAYVAKAAPDGYTLLLDASNHTQNPALREKLQYDTLGDFDSVSLLLRVPIVLTVTPDSPLRSVKDVIEQGKVAPALHYASSGPGSSTHLAAELFNLSAGAKLVHVPYKGGGPAMIDVMSGQVPIMFASLGSSIPHIRSGKLRALAVGGVDRSDVLPDLPTLREAGVDGYEAYEWNAVFAPKGTPPEVINRVSEALKVVLNDPKVKASLDNIGAEIIGSTPQALETFRRQDIEKWRTVAKEAKISLDN